MSQRHSDSKQKTAEKSYEISLRLGLCAVGMAIHCYPLTACGWSCLILAFIINNYHDGNNIVNLSLFPLKCIVIMTEHLKSTYIIIIRVCTPILSCAHV